MLTLNLYSSDEGLNWVTNAGALRYYGAKTKLLVDYKNCQLLEVDHEDWMMIINNVDSEFVLVGRRPELGVKCWRAL